jgi:hypothetical protein
LPAAHFERNHMPDTYETAHWFHESESDGVIRRQVFALQNAITCEFFAMQS